ncbi:MAG: sugar phosphate isomerase/epimerase [Planctomycetaceae bacterium]
MLSRRQFLATGAAAVASRQIAAADKAAALKLRYILATPMYGYAPLAEIVPEAARVGATHIDIWPKVHGNQREQLDEMGEQAFAELLAGHQLRLGCITQYQLGPFGLQGEMRLAQRLGCELLVCGGRGPKDAVGKELKVAVAAFIEQLKPHLEVAEETGTTIAIENHANNLIDSPDSLKWLAELRPSKHLGIAFAPYHLPQDEKLQSDLIRALGNSIRMFYAWEHGMGCHKKLPKEQELMQMPGRGSFDFTPLLAALGDVKYDGWTEIFMHPVPRGVPILDSSDKITAEINRSRRYLEDRLPPG